MHEFANLFARNHRELAIITAAENPCDQHGNAPIACCGAIYEFPERLRKLLAPE
jgi:hypothetical protein